MMPLGQDEKYAQDFLERIAAICNPIMKKHRLAVMSLEEYEYNTEFLGRNFNGGEVIQLVLKGRGGGWLPFRFVQMVMMHELAHNVQMNHSSAFWKVKNTYSDELRELWTKGYTGEAMWSRGRTLLSGQYVTGGAAPDDGLLEHLCGGTFRTSGKRKRFSKPKLSWKEQRERRIKKKFGVDGKTLGADDEVKSELERGKKSKGKPRVAGSNRGRELRAAAALARFEVPKKEKPEVKDENDISTDSGSDTEGDAGIGEAHDIDGSTLHDLKGRTMVKVCDDEEKDDVNVKNEMDELLQLQNIPDRQEGVENESDNHESKRKAVQKRKRNNKSSSRESLIVDFGPDAEPSAPPEDQEQPYGSRAEGMESDPELSDESGYTKSKPTPKPCLVSRKDSRPQVFDGSESESDFLEKNPKFQRELFLPPKARKEKNIANQFFGNLAAKAKDGGKEKEKDKPLKAAGRNTKSGTVTPEVAFKPWLSINHSASTPAAATAADSDLDPISIPDDFPKVINCPVCTSENDINASVCSVCSNVLDPDQLEGTWKCRSEACIGSEYANAADYGVCGVCGEPKR